MSHDTLPLRPMTVAEVLDAAIIVVRRRPLPILLTAVVLAGAEQAVLYPLRRSVFGPGTLYGIGAYWDAFQFHTGALWWLLAVGFGTEALIVALLGVATSRSAVALLVDAQPTGVTRPALPNRRLLLAVPMAVLMAVGAAASWFLAAVPWVVWFMSTGLATPALVIEAGRIGMFRAIGRSFTTVWRAGGRPGGLRLLTYTVWLFIRILVGLVSGVALAQLLTLTSSAWTAALGYAVWIAINAVAYAILAGLDAASYLEARIRVEGLDITLARAPAGTAMSLLGASR
ncbi:MAG TPA: hypothetical protein VGJ28_11015 [Micromonosporaceae bacterium]